ncbi:MAG: TPM domain-containing protein [Patescibacteria group bacterium]
MKKVFLVSLLLLPVFAAAFTVPDKPSTYVNDYTGILALSAEQEAILEEKVANFEKSTTNEIAVVVINSLEGDTIENVAQNIFTAWGIGKADKNNGVLVLVSVDDRQARIHTGYGVEGDLPDLATYYIQQDFMIPAFREGNYFLGIDNGLDKIIEALGGANIVPEGYTKQSSSGINIEMLLFFGFIVFEVLFSMLAKSKSWWGGGVVGGVLGGGIIWYFGLAFLAGIFAFVVPVVIGLIIDYFVSKSYGHARSLGTYPWWMGRGGGSGGGGFGGFGGGMSGGGGSSTRW